jgi:hypothetical protein
LLSTLPGTSGHFQAFNNTKHICIGIIGAGKALIVRFAYLGKFISPFRQQHEP